MQKNDRKGLLDGIVRISAQLNQLLEDFAENPERRVLKQTPMSDLSNQLKIRALLKEGGLSHDKLDHFLETFLANSQGMHHPAYMGHQVAVPNSGGAWAELIHGAINNPMAIYEMGPSAATIEMEVIYWMLGKTSWQDIDRPLKPWEQGLPAGVLTHGGSLANLTCLLAARAAMAPDAWQDGAPRDLCILAPKSSHYCIERSAAILGLGIRSIKWLPTDEYDRIIVSEIKNVYDQALADGQRVLTLIANACITSTGLHDDLDFIGKFCSERNIWFHVDGAHGASALLSEKHKHQFKGLEHARSMIWDAHKMLRVPALSAAVLFRDFSDMQGTFQQEGSYIFHDKDQPGIDTLAYTLECTKAGLGTKTFMTIALDGEDKITEYIDSRYQLAQEAFHYISELENFECLVQPETNIVCFNYVKIDAIQLRKLIIAEGRFYLTTTKVNGKSWLRLTFMNPETSMAQIKGLLRFIEIECTESA